MLICPKVCAEFHDRNGETLYKVTPSMLKLFQEAPEAIRDDPLFHMLRESRLLEVGDNGPRQKQLENDPDAPLEEPAKKAPKKG